MERLKGFFDKKTVWFFIDLLILGGAALLINYLMEL